MTPTPTAGDIWEWDGHHDPGVFLLLKHVHSAVDNYWVALDLMAGAISDVAIHEFNAMHWRQLA